MGVKVANNVSNSIEFGGSSGGTIHIYIYIYVHIYIYICLCVIVAEISFVWELEFSSGATTQILLMNCNIKGHELSSERDVQIADLAGKTWTLQRSSVALCCRQ